MDSLAEQPFYISATASASRPRMTLKHNDAFAVFDSHGDMGAAAGGPDGLFDCDTRFLSYLEVFIAQAQPLLLGSSMREDNLHMYVDLTNPDILEGDALVLPKDSIHISKTMFLRDGVMRIRLGLENHSGAAASFELAIRFDNDFADIFEVRGVHRKLRGAARRQVVGPGDLVLTYVGLDNVRRESALCFEPPPAALGNRQATYAIHLKEGGRRAIFVSVSCRGRSEAPVGPFFKGLRELDRERKTSMGRVASIETSSGILNEVLSRSIADFYMLVSNTAEGPYPYAGIPWFSTTFGRDGLISALQVLWLDPGIARGVLKRLAALQAFEHDPANDAQPGKILHEMRGGEMAGLREVPFGLYYGSVDATPLFIVLAGLYVQRTGDDALLRELWPNIERALAWIDRHGDLDGDGFVEYQRATETGLSNQGWKDSYDSVFHADGTLAEGPIALVEVQAYVYAAKQLAGWCAQRLGLAERATDLANEAEALRARFEEAFWVDRLGTYALALDHRKRPCEVRSSNALHTLFGGIASPERALRLAREVQSGDFMTGWGVRTLARGEPRYNPMSYHNGSVWPHDNAMIACGLARYGLKEPIEPIFEGLCRAATWMDQRRLPELFCGFRGKLGRGPTLYPVACSPQAWASGAPFMILQSMLGLEFVPAAREIRLRNPIVPAFVGEITVGGLQLGEASVDFSVRRDGAATSLRILRNHGSIQVTLMMEPTRAVPFAPPRMVAGQVITV